MKSFITTLFVFTLILFTSCNNDDNSVELPISLNDLWNLSNVSGGFAGVNIDYEQGLATWNFDPDALILTVEIGILNTDAQQGFLPIQSGTYDYSILESNGNTYLTIQEHGIYDNGEYGRFELNEAGDLIIDQGESSSAEADDVFILYFVR